MLAGQFLAALLSAGAAYGGESTAGPMSADTVTDRGTFRGPGVRDVLGSDGRIDLTRLIQSGYEGPIDLDGFRCTLGAASEGPTLIPTSEAPAARVEGDEYWWGGFCENGVNDAVRGMAVYDGALIVGGLFTEVGGNPIP